MQTAQPFQYLFYSCLKEILKIMILWQYKIEEKTYLSHLFFQFDWLIL